MRKARHAHAAARSIHRADTEYKSPTWSALRGQVNKSVEYVFSIHIYIEAFTLIRLTEGYTIAPVGFPSAHRFSRPTDRPTYLKRKLARIERVLRRY